MLSQYSGISHLPPLFTKVVLINSGDSSIFLLEAHKKIFQHHWNLQPDSFSSGSKSLQLAVMLIGSPLPPKLQVLPSSFHLHICQRLSKSDFASWVVPSSHHSPTFALDHWFPNHAPSVFHSKVWAGSPLNWRSHSLWEVLHVHQCHARRFLRFSHYPRWGYGSAAHL